MDLLQLPTELFLAVAQQLPPRDLVRARRVSRGWHAAFTCQATSLRLLRLLSPRCREVRIAAAVDGLISAPGPPPPQPPAARQLRDGRGDEAQAPPTLDSAEAAVVAELERLRERPRDWAAALATVARRYDHLSRATPSKVLTLPTAQFGDADRDLCFLPVPPCVLPDSWSVAGRPYPWEWYEPPWSYDTEQGLLVYPKRLHPSASGLDETPASPGSSCHATDGSGGSCLYRLVDLESLSEAEVPFVTSGRIIRRVRLSSSVLIFEWTQRSENVDGAEDWRGALRAVTEQGRSGYFVTAFDIVRVRRPGGTPPWAWRVTPKAQWPFPAGDTPPPAGGCEMFSSAHDARYYALLVANRRAGASYAAIWDMGAAANGASRHRVLNRRDLEHYGIHRFRMVNHRGIRLHRGSLCFLEESHRWQEPQYLPPRGHIVSCTAIPIVPLGPDDPSLPWNDGEDKSQGSLSSEDHQEAFPAVQGPAWFDICGEDEEVHLPSCGRVWGSNGSSRGWDAVQQDLPPCPRLRAQTEAVRYDAGAPFIWKNPTASPEAGDRDHQTPGLPSASSLASPSKAQLRDLLFGVGTGSGSECNSTGPLEAPCWRHEDLPRVTEHEVVDQATGVRFTLQTDFLVHLASRHTAAVHLSVSVPGAGTAQVAAGRLVGNRCSDGGNSDPDGDDGWRLCAGYMAGDERWLIGSGPGGNVTVLIF